jgi:RNA polymerase sigma-70 factor (ECF subfamily)
MASERLAALPREDDAMDAELIPRILDGETALYAVLMRRHNQRMFRVVRAIVVQDDEAEDVVQQAYVKTEQDLGAGPGPTPEDEAYRHEMTKLLENQIDGLPESLRVAFVLRDVEELSTAEAALALDISEEAVRVRLHRARALLQERLSSTMAAAPDAFHFAGARCDRLVLSVCERLHIG